MTSKPRLTKQQQAELHAFARSLGLASDTDTSGALSRVLEDVGRHVSISARQRDAIDLAYITAREEVAQSRRS